MTTAETDRTRSLENELTLYRSLATAGMASAVFAHEILKPIDVLNRLISSIEKKLPQDVRKSVERPFELLKSARARMQSYVQLPLNLLKIEKRRSGVIEVHRSINTIIADFEPHFVGAGTTVETNFMTNDPQIFGSPALLDGIFVNLFTNSVTAFTKNKTNKKRNRKILVKTEYSDEGILITVSDNGPGFSDVKINEIWLPGITTTPGGTGFGLTIVRDSIRDLGGKVRAVDNGVLGGADFHIYLPINNQG